MKRLDYSLLGQELKAQTGISKKQYQGLNKLFKPDEIEEPVTIKKGKQKITSKSKLMHDRKFSFSEYVNIIKYYDLSFTTKYDKLLSFHHRLNKFRNLIPQTKKTKKTKKIKTNDVYKMLQIYIIHS